MMPTRTKGFAIAIMAAGLLGCDKKPEGTAASSASPASPASPASTTRSASSSKPEKTAIVFCAGVNSCAGQSVRKYGKNACAGKNACKGQGVVKLTAEECETQGGKIEPN